MPGYVIKKFKNIIGMIDNLKVRAQNFACIPIEMGVIVEQHAILFSLKSANSISLTSTSYTKFYKKMPAPFFVVRLNASISARPLSVQGLFSYTFLIN